MVFYFIFAPYFSFLTNEISAKTANIFAGKKKVKIQKYYVARMLAIENMNMFS